MRTPWLQNCISSLTAGILVTAISGCAGVGGTMANSSGMGYYEKGNFAAAADEFQNALSTDPGNPDYLANFAKARMKMGDVMTAERSFRQALTVDPSHQPSYHGLAELMLDQGRHQEAQMMLTTWAGAQPYIPESHVELAWLHRELGNREAAADSLERALEINPSHSVALAHLGQYYEETGQVAEAVEMYQQSLQANWNQPEVHSRMAAASQIAGSASPMAATAMARGVHPYSVPRQQTAFGPPSPGAQVAQMQMLHSQAAMSGYPGGTVVGNSLAAYGYPAHGHPAYGHPGSGYPMTGHSAGGYPVTASQPTHPAHSIPNSAGMVSGPVYPSGPIMTAGPRPMGGIPSAGQMNPAETQFADPAGWPAGFHGINAPAPVSTVPGSAAGPQHAPTPDPAFSWSEMTPDSGGNAAVPVQPAGFSVPWTPSSGAAVQPSATTAPGDQPFVEAF